MPKIYNSLKNGLSCKYARCSENTRHSHLTRTSPRYGERPSISMLYVIGVSRIIKMSAAMMATITRATIATVLNHITSLGIPMISFQYLFEPLRLEGSNV